jgi:hypothetical protein
VSFLALFFTGWLRGLPYSKLFLTDDQRDLSRLGISRHTDKLGSGLPFPWGYWFPEPGGTDMKPFAHYVGSLHAGSTYSKLRNVRTSYAFLLDSLVLCCLPFFSLQKESRETVDCVRHWAKGGLMLAALVLCYSAYGHSMMMECHFGMSCLAKRLRKECLSKSMELEKGKTSGKVRLETLVRRDL